jgi:TRAP-type mannitol/chloroaromatic compound transport system substrate-binding protein
MDLSSKAISRRGAIGVTLAGAAATVASPAIAQSQPALKWRMVTSYPKSLDALDGGCRLLAKIVSDLTDGKFDIQVFAAGEVVPALQVLDAVQSNTVEMGHSAS